MATSSKCCVTQICYSQSPCPRVRPLLTRASTGDAQTLKGRSESVCMGASGFDSKCDFAPPTILLGLLLCSWMWGIFFFFFGRFQHSPIDGCSAASCNFGVLTGVDEYTSFYSAILIFICNSIRGEGNWQIEAFNGVTGEEQMKARVRTSTCRYIF